MRKLYFFVVLAICFIPFLSHSQGCAAVTATYVANESRCASTGSIQINASGGSGSYQYKVDGPVNTNYTSSTLITGLIAGRYLVTIKDIVSNCVYSNDSVTVSGNYLDPVFSLATTDVTCINGTDGTITLISQNYGLAPFSYQIVAPSASQVGTVSATGVFTGLVPGDYFIQLTDSCGAIQTRSATILNYNWSINSLILTRIACDSIAITIKLIDSKGNITPNPVFNQFMYGASKAPGDTTWYSTNSFHYYKANKRFVKLFAKDKCGNIKFATWTDNVIPSVNATVLITNKACATLTATIIGQTNLASPRYCIYDITNTLITCNYSGSFNNITYGSYCISITDSCYDTTITRCFTVVRPIPSVAANVLINANCHDFTATVAGQTNLNNPDYCLYNSGNVLMYCNNTGIFPNLPFGEYCIKIVNDSACYDTTIIRCFTVIRPLPYVGLNVTIINITCTTFTVVVNDTAHLYNPLFCLYTLPHVVIACNSTGVFNNLPFGTYCIDVQNDPACFDTTITRCFTVNRPVPSLDNTVAITNQTCTTFTATITGQTNINNAQYCLYNNLNELQACNTTGIFTNISLGSYCITTQNDMSCYDTLITRCFTVLPIPVNISLLAQKSCVTIGNSDILVNITYGLPDYSLSLYLPNGSLIQTASTGASTFTFSNLPNLTFPEKYKVVLSDQCGNKDSATISPSISVVKRVITITQRCPSGTMPGGSGDVLVDITNNNISGDIIPKIIKKNGTPVSINATSNIGYEYTFANLIPAIYIFDTYVNNCNKHIYDTVTIKIYLYPNLLSSKAYQCDNNDVTINANVVGGNSPYTYEIIGSLPSTPSIITTPQASPFFTINNGTAYSLIRLRVTDACGNAGLHDANVLPLANFIIYADSLECFDHKLTLRVDSIPNTVYTWYKRIPVNDSIIVGTGPSYTILNLMPGDTGRYFCKIVLNNGCLIKFANYVVTGWCGTILPTAITLNGINFSKTINKLYWNAVDNGGVTKYELERSETGRNVYSKIGDILPTGQNSFNFLDEHPAITNNLYRLKLYYAGNVIRYSNVVKILNTKFNISIYPNPVNSLLFISIKANVPTKYLIEIFTISGQKLSSNEYIFAQNKTIEYPRTPSMANGLYNLIITNLLTNEKEVYKLIYN